MEHFLLYCPETEENRQELLHKLNYNLGVIKLDIQLLLGYENHEEMKNWRQDILIELASFLEKTDRFTASVKPAASQE